MRTAEPAALRSSGGGPDRATFLELFFDLVYVFALTRISARAFEDLVLEGGQTGWSAVPVIIVQFTDADTAAVDAKSICIQPPSTSATGSLGRAQLMKMSCWPVLVLASGALRRDAS